MAKEKSAGAIIFRVTDKGFEYLLLHYPSSAKAKKGYWDFPKGHMEKGETEEDTVQREVKEETGLEDIELLGGFREVISYWFKFQGKTVSKTVIFYLARAKTQEITLSSEHVGYRWLLYEEALLRLTYENAKELLKKAQAFLAKEA